MKRAESRIFSSQLQGKSGVTLDFDPLCKRHPSVMENTGHRETTSLSVAMSTNPRYEMPPGVAVNIGPQNLMSLSPHQPIPQQPSIAVSSSRSGPLLLPRGRNLRPTPQGQLPVLHYRVSLCFKISLGFKPPFSLSFQPLDRSQHETVGPDSAPGSLTA